MSRRRFIAGAVCPRCSQMDSIFVYQQDGDEYRACCECDFEEKADFAKTDNKIIEKELPTRVNSENDPSRDVEIQTIKIVDN